MGKIPLNLDRQNRARQTGRLLRELDSEYHPIQFISNRDGVTAQTGPLTIQDRQIPDHWGLVPLMVFDTEDNQVEGGYWPLNLN